VSAVSLVTTQSVTFAAVQGDAIRDMCPFQARRLRLRTSPHPIPFQQTEVILVAAAALLLHLQTAAAAAAAAAAAVIRLVALTMQTNRVDDK